MSAAQPEVTFPQPEFVRRGPPLAVKDLHRQSEEKWGRVMLVLPRPVETSARIRNDFVTKGPYILPLAVRREGTDLGSREAWQFFTHPSSVFPPDATFYNVPGDGCLGARLFVQAPEGVRLYDEVGANLKGSEFVAESFQGALGVLRHRVLGQGGTSESPLAPDLLQVDIDLCEMFHLCTVLLRTTSPADVLSRLYSLFQRPTLHHFAWDVFSEEEHTLMRSVREQGASTDHPVLARLRVSIDDFTKITDVRDGTGKQAILELLSEWESFEQEHGERLRELGLGIQQEEANLEEIKSQVVRLQQADSSKRGLSRLFSRSASKTIKELKADAVRALRAKRALEAAFDQIPGYDRVRGLTDRVQGFKATISSVHGMARNLDDQNVGKELINSMRTLVRSKIQAEDPERVRQGYRAYDLHMRADVLPKLLSTYSVSAYVLRRPDALRPGSPSFRSIHRINELARRVIEYFRYVRYGATNLGDAFDSGWGQVIQLEARL